jgi:hypothetical protein
MLLTHAPRVLVRAWVLCGEREDRYARVWTLHLLGVRKSWQATGGYPFDVDAILALFAHSCLAYHGYDPERWLTDVEP